MRPSIALAWLPQISDGKWMTLRTTLVDSRYHDIYAGLELNARMPVVTNENLYALQDRVVAQLQSMNDG